MIEDLDKWEVRIMDHGYGVYRWSDNIPYGTFIQREHAVLFSAAPALLDACEELLLVAGTSYSPIDMYDWERVSAVIDQAKAALKKARGES